MREEKIYAIKAHLALEEVDFKRHKDVVAYFNKTYAATEKIPREIGRIKVRILVAQLNKPQ